MDINEWFVGAENDRGVYKHESLLHTTKFLHFTEGKHNFKES